ncbi:carbohydrate-binding protein [Streptomyces sp. NPDC003015]
MGQAARPGLRPLLHPGRGVPHADHRPPHTDHPHRERPHALGRQRHPAVRRRPRRHLDAPGRKGDDCTGAGRGTAATGVLDSGDWVAFRKANISGKHLTVRLDSACARACSFQLRLEAPDGPVAAVVPVTGTGNWQELSVPLKREVTGAHDLYLVAKGLPRPDRPATRRQTPRTGHPQRPRWDTEPRCPGALQPFCSASADTAGWGRQLQCPGHHAEEAE